MGLAGSVAFCFTARPRSGSQAGFWSTAERLFVNVDNDRVPLPTLHPHRPR